jgi:hypothetical protein
MFYFGLRTFGYKVNNPDRRKSLVLACRVQGKERVINRLQDVSSKSMNQTMLEDLNWLKALSAAELQVLYETQPPLYSDHQILCRMYYNDSPILYVKIVLLNIYENTDYNWFISAINGKRSDHVEFVQKLHQARTSKNFVPYWYKNMTEQELFETGYTYKHDGEFGRGYYRNGQNDQVVAPDGASTSTTNNNIDISLLQPNNAVTNDVEGESGSENESDTETDDDSDSDYHYESGSETETESDDDMDDDSDSDYHYESGSETESDDDSDMDYSDTESETESDTDTYENNPYKEAFVTPEPVNVPAEAPVPVVQTESPVGNDERDLQLYDDLVKKSHYFLKAAGKIISTKDISMRVLAASSLTLNEVQKNLTIKRVCIQEKEKLAKNKSLDAQKALDAAREALRKLTELAGGAELLQNDKATQELLAKLV